MSYISFMSFFTKKFQGSISKNVRVIDKTLFYNVFIGLTFITQLLIKVKNVPNSGVTYLNYQLNDPKSFIKFFRKLRRSTLFRKLHQNHLKRLHTFDILHFTIHRLSPNTRYCYLLIIWNVVYHVRCIELQVYCMTTMSL